MRGRIVSQSTLANLSAFGAGLVFAIGLAISGMTHPRKILGFLDPRASGGWDPSLAFVMLGALVVAAAAFPQILQRSRPLLANRFALPTKREIEPRLVMGAALFGLGWGLGGFCPGPAVVVLVTGALPVLVFVASMLAGMALFDLYTLLAGAEKTGESVRNRS